MNKVNGVYPKQAVEKLLEMGFEKSKVMEAVEGVGLSVDDGVEYILSGCCPRDTDRATGSSSKKVYSSGQKRQSSILDHFRPMSTSKKTATGFARKKTSLQMGESCLDERTPSESFPVRGSEDLVAGSDWERKANNLLKKHFGYSSLKDFQREALSAWIARKDCLVLAATGSGKSLCFQIPALLTGKVVVVISPLISLMHDQCLKLAKHGVSACFLGSGQPDSSVENKAMRGMYSVIYVCPETVLRLIQPLQRLAENRGIALFAVDEVHCVSKWGHDFRPDYRRMSVLRESFSASKLEFLEFDIPLMALTATATTQVRGDILVSLSMSKETKVVVTSFFRPNLRFSVKHSRTSSPASYKKDFLELINAYTRKQNTGGKKRTNLFQEANSAYDSTMEADAIADNDSSDVDVDDDDSDREGEPYSNKKNGSRIAKGKVMSVEYLENDVDVFSSVDDWDVAYGEFCAQAPHVERDIVEESETVETPNAVEERSQLFKGSLELGPTIIYVPTRKETLKIANYLCGCGVKAAAYHAALPKSHLRQVHKEFQENALEVVVATIAFGMGIDKLNVRRIIHYGWPQSLEAYYQEAGRAGRDGKLSDCILIANLTRTPSLLPSKRSEEQTRQAYKMLTDCFRYVMNSSCCRAEKLVEYFGEEFSPKKCLVCDVCNNGPPEMQNLKEEATILMQVIAAYHTQKSSDDGSYHDESTTRQQKIIGKPNMRLFVSKIREQSQKFMATDWLWWQGLARIMEGKGLIREGDEKTHVQVKFPEATKLGLEFLRCKEEQAFYVHPEADMLLSVEKKPQPFSRFSDWGKGWADPEIRRQRLERMSFGSKRSSSPRKPSNRKPRNRRPRNGNL